MRDSLHKFKNTKKLYSANVEKFGTAHGGTDHTLLLTGIKDYQGNNVCNHAWVIITKPIARAALNIGEKIKFTAVVKLYERVDGSIDLGFAEVNNLQRRGYKASFVSAIA